MNENRVAWCGRVRLFTSREPASVLSEQSKSSPRYQETESPVLYRAFFSPAASVFDVRYTLQSSSHNRGANSAATGNRLFGRGHGEGVAVQETANHILR